MNKYVYNQIKNIKNNILPKKTNEIIALNEQLNKYVNKYVLDEPYKFNKYLTGGGDDDLNKIMDIYKKININEVHNNFKLSNKILDDTLLNFHKNNKNNKNIIQHGGFIYFLEQEIDWTYINELYINPTLLVETDYFMPENYMNINRLYALKMLGNPYFVNMIGYSDHAQFVINTTLNTYNQQYRYIDKNILQYNINLIDNIISEHTEFYNKFKLTFDILHKFCIILYDNIGENIIDTTLLTPNILATGNNWILAFNYCITLLNNFKVLIDDIKKN
jgi:hypothetical protein